MQEKATLRREMRTLLRNVGDHRAAKSEALCTALAGRSDYLRSVTVAIFDPLGSEPDVSLLWEIAPRRFAYPRIVDGRLQLFAVESISDLQATTPDLPFREPPPVPEQQIPFRQLDLILVPGLAFSRDGRRLGRGGGYYDRLLASLSPRTSRVGVCFSFQVLEDLPTERHDERVNAVVTD